MSKITCKLYRVTTVPTAEVLANAGMNPDSEGSSETLMRALKDKFGPFAPRLEWFLPSEVSHLKTVIGMEVMSFDINQAEVPQAGLVMSDPMDPRDVDRLDGALESELNRMGLGTNFEGYEWRMAFRVKGN